jgi:TonB family protein
MKTVKYLLLPVFAFLFCSMYAQTDSTNIEDSIYNTCAQCDSLYNQICPANLYVYSDHEGLAEFPGGDRELKNFIRKNLQYPVECKEKAIQGRVVVRFIINESGRISCLYVFKSVHPALDKEALRIVKLMPDWKPTFTGNDRYKSCFTLPITFKLPDVQQRKNDIDFRIGSLSPRPWGYARNLNKTYSFSYL